MDNQSQNLEQLQREVLQKTGGKKPAQTREPRKGKRAAKGVSEEAKPKEVAARPLNKAVSTVENKADNSIGKQPDITPAVPVADKQQKASCK